MWSMKVGTSMKFCTIRMITKYAVLVRIVRIDKKKEAVLSNLG